jgi:hypothetical protein
VLLTYSHFERWCQIVHRSDIMNLEISASKYCLTLSGRLACARESSSADRGQKLAAAVALGIPPDILAPSARIGTRAAAAASQNITPAASASR